MANRNPVCKLTSPNPEPLSEQPLTIRVPLTIDVWVRSLPNKTEWLRQVITEAYQREIKSEE